MLLGIPGDTQRLQATFADLDQVLLERRDAEGVGDFEIGVLAVESRPVDPEFFALAHETGGLVFGVEGDVVKVTKHGFGGGRLHGQLVV
ncbi:hypothetical protein D3C86_1960140 [compost metagenome]